MYVSYLFTNCFSMPAYADLGVVFGSPLHGMSTATTWEAVELKGDAPLARGGHAVVLVELLGPSEGASQDARRLALVIGGADPFGMVTDAVTAVDVATGRCWAPKLLGDARLPARCSHSAVIVPLAAKATTSTASEAPATSQSSSAAAASGSGDNAVARVLVFGGTLYAPNAPPVVYDDLWELSVVDSAAEGDKKKKGLDSPCPVALRWKRLTTTGDQPGRRHSFGSCLVGAEWIVALGANGDEPLGPQQTGFTGAVHALDTASLRWRRLDVDVGAPREMVSCAALRNGDGSRVFAISGGRAAVFTPSGEPEPALSSRVYRVELPEAATRSSDVASGDSTAACRVTVMADGERHCRIAHSLLAVVVRSAEKQDEPPMVLAVGGQAAQTEENPLGFSPSDPATDGASSLDVSRVDRRGRTIHFGIGHSAATAARNDRFEHDMTVVVGGLAPDTIGAPQAVWRLVGFAASPA